MPANYEIALKFVELTATFIFKSLFLTGRDLDKK